MAQKIDFVSLLHKSQEYISENYAAALSDRSKVVQLRSYIEKYLHDSGFEVEGMTFRELSDKLYSEMAEYSVLTKYLGRDEIEEININGWDDIAVTYTDGHIEKAKEHFYNPQHAVDVVKRLLHHSGMIIDNATPMSQGHLPGNTRITALKEPLVDDDRGISVSIRLLHPSRVDMKALVKGGNATQKMIDFLCMCLRYGISFVVAGATSSGKTTLLNALLTSIPDNKRIFSFVKAVEIITGYAAVLPPVYTGIEKPIGPKELELPEYNTDICEVRRYLKSRGISDTVIDYCHENKMLYEDAKYHNCVFLGYDGNTPKYGAVRSTVSDFKRDLTGSDKRFSFFIPAESDTGTVHLFESAIDLLSYASLEIRIKRNWRRDDLLSLAGVYKTDKKQDIPLALRTYLERHTGTKAVYLHLDNDEVGRMATKQITEALSSQYTVIDQPPQSGKDFNDYLKNEIQKEKRKEQVR